MLRIQTVLFPTDPTTWAEDAFAQIHALRRAAAVAAQHGGALHVLAVSPSVARPAGVLLTAEAPPGSVLRACLDEAAAAHPGLRVFEVDLSASSPVTGVLDYIARVDADLVVMATHSRRGLGHLLLGSVAEAVVRGATCPVLTVGPTARLDEDRPQRILAPADFSRHARRALAYAKELAHLYGAELHVLHVVEAEPIYGRIEVRTLDAAVERRVRARLAAFARKAGRPDVAAISHAVAGKASEEVLAAAERLDAGLVVIATHGRHGLRRVALGSVAERVVQRAPCPVFTVKAFGKLLLQPTAEAAEAA